MFMYIEELTTKTANEITKSRLLADDITPQITWVRGGYIGYSEAANADANLNEPAEVVEDDNWMAANV